MKQRKDQVDDFKKTIATAKLLDKSRVNSQFKEFNKFLLITKLKN